MLECKLINFQFSTKNYYHLKTFKNKNNKIKLLKTLSHKSILEEVNLIY